MMGNIDIILICHFKNTLYFRQLVSLHSLGFMHLYIYKSNQLDITKVLKQHGGFQNYIALSNFIESVCTDYKSLSSIRQLVLSYSKSFSRFRQFVLTDWNSFPPFTQFVLSDYKLQFKKTIYNPRDKIFEVRLLNL